MNRASMHTSSASPILPEGRVDNGLSRQTEKRSLNVHELRNLMALLGLPVEGNKVELKQRLMDVAKEKPPEPGFVERRKSMEFAKGAVLTVTFCDGTIRQRDISRPELRKIGLKIDVLSGSKTVARPEPPGRRPGVGDYLCETGCGFRGSFSAVADHETGCGKFTTTASTKPTQNVTGCPGRPGLHSNTAGPAGLEPSIDVAPNIPNLSALMKTVIGALPTCPESGQLVAAQKLLSALPIPTREKLMMQLIRRKANGGIFTELAAQAREQRLGFAAVVLETLFGEKDVCMAVAALAEFITREGAALQTARGRYSRGLTKLGAHGKEKGENEREAKRKKKWNPKVGLEMTAAAAASRADLHEMAHAGADLNAAAASMAVSSLLEGFVPASKNRPFQTVHCVKGTAGRAPEQGGRRQGSFVWRSPEQLVELEHRIDRLLAEIFIRFGISTNRQLERARKIFMAHNRSQDDEGDGAAATKSIASEKAAGDEKPQGDDAQAGGLAGSSDRLRQNTKVLSTLMFGIDFVAPMRRMRKVVNEMMVPPSPPRARPSDQTMRERAGG
jgi:hypothetical protein